ncbi:cistern family PEP-CTERM protein [Leptolyngbya sp. PCC 6406]|uniref:cistern family PEP-CTERM protein n=1 Tax=Leptolyngbya sp. PCC 6406 TaxID=1173264 RepID=UPI0002ACBBD3|nr:cistern family PEP-CTERM protein [Leptolyngbya sp. PCC 6406]
MQTFTHSAPTPRARQIAVAMTLKGRFLTLAGIAALALMPVPALAFNINTQTGETAGNPAGQALEEVEITANDIGQSFVVNWALPGSGSRADLTASAEFTIVELTSNSLVLDVTLTNQTSSSFQAAIMSLGLAVNTTLSNVTLASAGGTFSSITPNPTQNFPGGFKNINACIFAANTCSGGAIFNGLQSGGNGDSFRVTLSGSFASSVTLASFPIKFQTEAGSYELAGSFGAASSTTLITESSSSEESVETTSVSQTQTTETVTSETVVSQTTTTTTTEFSETVAQTILQQVSQQSNISISELRILEVSRQTWSDGCLGLGQPGTACTQALVEGYWVTVASRQDVFVYRTNSVGSLVVIDQVRTQEYRSKRPRRRKVKLSRRVHQSVLQKIAETYQVDVSSLRVSKVKRKHWRNDCLGLPAGPGRGRACGRGKVKGYMIVVTSGQDSWVCRSDRRGTYVVVDEQATQLRRRQKQNRSSRQVVRYTDVSRSHWAWEYIQELSSLNILAGYPDGDYRPDQQVNRGELAAIVSRAFEYSQIRESVSFTDISTNYWGYNAAQAAYQLGFLETLTGNAFQPQASLTRAAALLAIANGLEIPNMTGGAAQSLLSNYSGLATSGEVQQLLASLIQEGIFVSYPNGNQLNLDQPITRAEVAVLIYQALASLGSVESIPSDFTGGTVAEDEVEIVDDDLLDDFDDLEDIEG